MCRLLLLIVMMQALSINVCVACGGFWDIACNLSKRFGDSSHEIGRNLDKATEDVGKAAAKAAHDVGNSVETEAHDTGKSLEKAAHDTGNAVEKAAHDKSAALTPSREYLRAQDIPPVGVGAYGVVVLHSRPTEASRAKLTWVCKSFVAFFPKSETSQVPVGDQMITVWPVVDPDNPKIQEDDCGVVLGHYDLNASESAINDARRQHAGFEGEGPYLVGWSPSNTRGVPDKLVLVVDMSADNTQIEIDHKFGFWKNKIIEDSSLWRNGWSLEGVRSAIKEFADTYGQNMLDAVKIVSGK